MYRTKKKGEWGDWLPILYSKVGLIQKLEGLKMKGEIEAFETK